MSANIKLTTHKPKKSEIEAIKRKTANVERALHTLEHVWKVPVNMKNINKWQKSVEEKINFLTKTLFEINELVKNNIQNIQEMKDVLKHNYENIKTIFEILKNIFEKDKKDKGLIYNTLKKKLPF